MNPPSDWTQFTLKIHIAKNLEDVYKAWATPAQLTTWFLDEADYFKADGSPRDPWQLYEAGDEFHWKWYNWDTIEKGKVLEANGTDLLKFSFMGEGEVHLSFSKTQDKTLLELTQLRIPTDDKSKMDIYCGCTRGWSFWMINLKAWLEHKVLLNDTNLDSEDPSLSQFVNS
ncbi:MAG: SRPBCC domain-containing protein [Bacteroidota bacterium]